MTRPKEKIPKKAPCRVYRGWCGTAPADRPLAFLSTLKAAIVSAGFSVEEHYQKYSSTEGTKAYTQMDFDEDYYLQSKLAQLASIGETGWTKDSLIKAINKAGMTVEQHFQKYSTLEGTSCNPYFNTTEYLEAKLKQLQNSADANERAEWADKTAADVAQAIKDAGMSAEEHYMRYGAKETDQNGNLINPSNAFDANAYAAAKLAQLQATDPDNWNGKTAQDVMDAITKVGLTPVSHYERYGADEANEADVAMVQTVPVVDRVANDPIRDMMGENVPSNYNAHTPAPKNISTGSEVTKPADMGGLADEDISPEVEKPADPVATPSDASYVVVPGNGIKDTNENPVELVTATTKDAQGNDVTVSQYGVTSTNEDGGSTTKAVDSTGKVTDDTIKSVAVGSDGSSTTTTEISKGSTTIKQSAVDDGKGTVTTTTEASLNGGTNTVEQTSTEVTGTSGQTTTNTTTAVKNAAGDTIMEESSVETANAAGTSSTTESTTTNYDKDGNVLSTTTATAVKGTAADGTVTTTTNGTTTDGDGTRTSFTTKETVATDDNGATVTKTDSTVKNAAGETISTSSETKTESMDNGTLTTDVQGKSTDSDGNVASVNEVTTSTTNPKTGVETTSKTVENEVVNKDGDIVAKESGTVETTTNADGSSVKTTDITTTDANGNQTTTQTTSQYNPTSNETTTTGTETTTTKDGATTTSSVNTTTSGDVASNSNTPAEQSAADATNNGDPNTPDEPDTPSGDSSGGGSDGPSASSVSLKLSEITESTKGYSENDENSEGTLAGADNKDTFTIDSKGEGVSATLSSLVAKGNAGDDTFVIAQDANLTELSTLATITFDGGVGNDKFEVKANPGAHVAVKADGGVGNDDLYYEVATEDTLSFDGGAGTNTLHLKVAPTTATLNFTGSDKGTNKIAVETAAIDLSSEKLSLENVSSVDVGTYGATMNKEQYMTTFTTITGSGVVTLSEALAEEDTLDTVKTDLKLADNANTVNITDANGKTITGGTGDDTFNVTAESTVEGATYDGGTGTDTLAIGADGDATGLTAKGFENLTMGAGADVSGLTISGDPLTSVTAEGTVTLTSDQYKGWASTLQDGTATYALTDALSGDAVATAKGTTKLADVEGNEVAAAAAGSTITAEGNTKGIKVTLKEGADVVTLGSGDDTVVFDANATAAAASQSISNFDASADKLDLEGVAALTGGGFQETTTSTDGEILNGNVAIVTGKATLAAGDFAVATGGSKPYLAEDSSAFVVSTATAPADGAAGTYHMYLVSNASDTITLTDLGSLSTVNGPLTKESFGRSSGTVEGFATFADAGATLTVDESVDGVTIPVTITLDNTGGSVKMHGNADDQASSEIAFTEKTTTLTFTSVKGETNVSFNGTSGGYGTASATPLVVNGADENVNVALTATKADYLKMVDGGNVTGALDTEDEVSGTFSYVPLAGKALSVTGGKLASDSGALVISAAVDGTAPTLSGTLEGSAAATLAVAGTDGIDLSGLQTKDEEGVLNNGLNAATETLVLGSGDDGQQVTLTSAQLANFTTLTGKAAGVSTAGDTIKISGPLTYGATASVENGVAAVASFDGTIASAESGGTVAISGEDAVDFTTGTLTLNFFGFTKLDLATDAGSNTLTLTSDQLAMFGTAPTITGKTVEADLNVEAAADKIVVTPGTNSKVINLTNASDITVDLSDDGWTVDTPGSEVAPVITFGSGAQHVVLASAVYNAMSEAGSEIGSLTGVEATDVIEMSAAIVDGNLNGGIATIQLKDDAKNTVTLEAVGDKGANVIAGSSGDTITSSAVNDIITLGADEDTVIFAQTNGSDTVNDFVVADDSLNIRDLGNGITTVTAVNSVTAVETKNAYVVNGDEDLDGTNKTAVATFLNTLFTGEQDHSYTNVFAINTTSGTGDDATYTTYIYNANLAYAAANTILADELTLVGTVHSDDALAADDLVVTV